MTALSKDQPYPGLRPFGSGDEEFFFGREAQALGLRRKLEASRLVAVVGRSGCGKSSLVRAGLVPLLAKELDSNGQPVWHIASFRPQGQPIAELIKELLRLAAETQQTPEDLGPPRPDTAGDAVESQPPPAEPGSLKPADAEKLRRSRLDAMLRRSSQGLVEAAAELALPHSAELLIIVDQFEEIFRFEGASDKDTDEATAFVRLLIEAIRAESVKVRVILTMRLDFLGDCARFQLLPEAISDGQFLVPNLNRSERRAAIEEPAKKCGRTVSPAVTQRLLNEIGDDPDQLPVLQHVLMRTWQVGRGSNEITLKHYEETGGVRNAISRHADQVFDDLPSHRHRLAAERMFKAISELDRRGRAVRRAQKHNEVVKVVDQTEAVVDDVIEAFRAPECCFLMPPVGEKLTPSTRIDISHESLLHGWGKMTGTSGKEGWIAQEDRNGRAYRNLLEAAEVGATLPPAIARQRQEWWVATDPNAAWADRYGNKFEQVDGFLKANVYRALIRRGAMVALAATVAILFFGLVGFGIYYFGSEQEKRALQARFDELDDKHDKLTLNYREAVNRVGNLQTINQIQEKELAQRALVLDRTVRQALSAVPATNQSAREELNTLLRTSTANPDSVVQRPIGGTPPEGGSAALLNRTGFMWLGSAQKSNLITPAGVSVPLDQVKPNEQYLIILDIYLRAGLPDPATYAQQATLGVMSEDTRIQILSAVSSFKRPSGDQYWARVRVVTPALPAVFLQFANGPRDQAQAVSKALRDKGYKVPGEERSGVAAKMRVVRYFYDEQKPSAQQLADDTTKVLQQFGYSQQPPVTTDLARNPIKSNLDGKLELWLDLPPLK